MKKIVLIAACLLALLSCNKDETGLTRDNVFSVTIGVRDIDDFSAILEGRASTINWWHKERCGFLVSAGKVPTWEQHDFIFQSDERDFPVTYTVMATGLKPETQYYYRAYTSHDDDYYLGDTKEFKTTAVNATVTTLDAIFTHSERKVLLRATLSYDKMYNYDVPISVWFDFVPWESVGNIHHESSRHSCNLDSGGSFEVTITGLESYDHYFYCPVAEVNGRIIYGQSGNFYTPDYSKY